MAASDAKPPQRERRTGPADRRSGDERRAGTRRSGFDRRNEAAWEPVAIEASGDESSEDAAVLVAAAIDARRHARAHFSNFKVGAALETDSGTVVTG